MEPKMMWHAPCGECTTDETGRVGFWQAVWFNYGLAVGMNQLEISLRSARPKFLWQKPEPSSILMSDQGRGEFDLVSPRSPARSLFPPQFTKTKYYLEKRKIITAAQIL